MFGSWRNKLALDLSDWRKNSRWASWIPGDEKYILWISRAFLKNISLACNSAFRASGVDGNGLASLVYE